MDGSADMNRDYYAIRTCAYSVIESLFRRHQNVTSTR